ncbi:MAG TPA: YolD-like family protein [Epulopiscium sp.]|nr:YolD-like family protein [Candidatus Epulonipiscium sp.]
MNNPYEDIINLPHHKSSKHPHMPRHSRAAQFSPFAALTGHGDAVREVARVTDKKVELDDDIKIDLNKRLHIIQEYIDKKPEVSIIYFQEDHLKEGGSYVIASGYVKKIDEYEGLVVMGDGRKVLISDMIEIDCALFASLRYD